MAENENDKHRRAPGQQAPAPQTLGASDPASQSLTRALRSSFYLLTVIMIGVVVAFLATGVTRIKPGQEGIKKLFGREVGVVIEGLAYIWPFPIGDIDVVDTSERTIEIDDFWMHETARDKTLSLEDRRPPRGGLRPGWDGMLLTGDRGVLHMKLTCLYRVADPVKFRKGLTDHEEALRSVVCAAAIHAAASQTADNLMRAGQVAFVYDVQREAQRRLDRLDVGIAISSIRLGAGRVTWPLEARSAYNAAQNAANEWRRLQDVAETAAKEILNSAADKESARKLVGEPWIGLTSPSMPGQTDKSEGLIDQYAAAREAGDLAEAQRLLREIDEVLTSNATGGEAKVIIEAARAYKTSLVQRVRSRAEEFEKLLPEFEKAPQFMIERIWAETVDEILGSPTVEKVVLKVHKQKVVLMTRQNPETARKILLEV
ncbi:MAG: hypothetical protein KAU28_10645, partial [Phycisphaerae bacterium]|nr:hypothetical protein [Phycisphaerae bacterium]